jgi:hypothetical protein
MAETDYSEFWAYPKIPEGCSVRVNLIDNLSKFIYRVKSRAICSDCLTVVIDEPRLQDVQGLHQLLKIAKRYDLMVIVTESPLVLDLSKYRRLFARFDYQYLMTEEHDYALFNWRQIFLESETISLSTHPHCERELDLSLIGVGVGKGEVVDM